MRLSILIPLLLLLAGCAATPQQLGITGPQGSTARPQLPATVRAPEAPSNDPLDNPDIMQSGTRYGPSYSPSTGGGSFWGYN